jgi:hypothetical protein
LASEQPDAVEKVPDTFFSSNVRKWLARHPRWIFHMIAAAKRGHQTLQTIH